MARRPIQLSSTSTDWMNAGLKRIEQLRTSAEIRALGPDSSDAMRIEIIRRQYEELCERLMTVIDHYDNSANTTLDRWNQFKIGTISLAGLASAVNIIAAATSDHLGKTILTCIAAILTVGVGTLSALEATFRWRDRHLGSSELRDLFFRLLTFVTSLWNLTGAAENQDMRTYGAASAIILYAVEEENELRARFNMDLRQQMSPSPGGTHRAES